MKRFFYIVLSLILVILAFYIFWQGGKQNASIVDPVEKTNDNPVTGSVSQADSFESDKYIIYGSSADLEGNANKKRLLYFYANWCPTCQPVDKSLKANPDQIPNGYVVIRINYNDTETDSSERELAKKYGVTYQHTFVQIDENGKAIKIWNGGSVDDLLQNII